MENLIPTLFIVLLASFALVVVFGSFLPIKRKKTATKINLDDLSLIVPFRNEKKRILPLINSLNIQKKLPKALYFVNDHSTDETTAFIRENLNDLACEVVFIDLTETQKGKKEAVFHAVKHAKTKYVHTMDADVFFDEYFFLRIENLPESDLLVLPVNIVGNGFLGSIFTLEYCSFQLLQLAFGKRKPLTASGANLIVNRKTYSQYNKLENHIHYASGDDQFVLQSFKKENLDIKTVLNNHLSVTTPAPPNIKALFAQRLRWMSKNSATFEWKSFIISLWVLTTQLLFVFSFILLMIKGLYIKIIFLFMLKTIIEMIQFSPILKRRNQFYLLGLMPIISFFYPIYLISMSVLSFLHKPLWKGREIYSEKGLMDKING